MYATIVARMVSVIVSKDLASVMGGPDKGGEKAWAHLKDGPTALSTGIERMDDY
jgi:hypothetical protein